MVKKGRKTDVVAEFGDFQTPPALALSAVRVLSRLGIIPRRILEPSCGRGAFLNAAACCFPQAEAIIGVDIRSEHLVAAADSCGDRRISLHQGDFFTYDWQRLIGSSGGPWLILGNPPWVTNSEVGALGGNNLPRKSNFRGYQGIEAITGKSNFDISEWMLLRYLHWLRDAGGTIAVLCKTAVARKILLHAWKGRYPIASARIYRIDARSQFGAAVDACFFVLETRPGAFGTQCETYDDLEATVPSRTFGLYDRYLIADMAGFARQRHIFGPDPHYLWRSGIKHDCSKVMELAIEPAGVRNGFGELVALESAFLFPLLKSSDIGNNRSTPRSMMLVTQRRVGQETRSIERVAPHTWAYLHRYAALLARRGSAIYKNKPAFSVFGVGGYSFAPWKVAISGLYKKLQFVAVGPCGGQPTVFDDTVNFLPCSSLAEATFLAELLRSPMVGEFFHSMIHWEDKRPVTVDILRRLSIEKIAILLGCHDEYRRYTAPYTDARVSEDVAQQRLFD